MPDSTLTALPEREARPAPVARLVSWTPWPFENAHLPGHCSISFSGGWLVHQVPVFRRKDGTITVGTPSAADLDREGRIKTDLAGKKMYRPIITFEGAAGRARWDRAVLTAIADAGIAPAGEATP